VRTVDFGVHGEVGEVGKVVGVKEWLVEVVVVVEVMERDVSCEVVAPVREAVRVVGEAVGVVVKLAVVVGVIWGEGCDAEMHSVEVEWELEYRAG